MESVRQHWWQVGGITLGLYGPCHSLERLLVHLFSSVRTSLFIPPADHRIRRTSLSCSRSTSTLHSVRFSLGPRDLGAVLRLDDGGRPTLHTLRLLRDLSVSRELGDHSDLEAVGKAYYEFRAALMVENDEGLTKTYNRFHDPDERDPEIVKLRELHAAMDRAVLDAYGWTDIPTECEFLLDYEIDEENWSPARRSPGATAGRTRSVTRCWRGSSSSTLSAPGRRSVPALAATKKRGRKKAESASPKTPRPETSSHEHQTDGTATR